MEYESEYNIFINYIDEDYYRKCSYDAIKEMYESILNYPNKKYLYDINTTNIYNVYLNEIRNFITLIPYKSVGQNDESGDKVLLTIEIIINILNYIKSSLSKNQQIEIESLIIVLTTIYDKLESLDNYVDITNMIKNIQNKPYAKSSQYVKNPIIASNVLDLQENITAYLDFHNTWKSIINYENEIKSSNIIIFSLGPGNVVDQYLPNYALDTNYYYNKNILILAYEPGIESFKALNDEQMKIEQINKRYKLFGISTLSENLNIHILPYIFNISAIQNSDYKEFDKAFKLIINNILNPLLKNKFIIIQCGIRTEICKSLYNIYKIDNFPMSGFISVKGNDIYKINNIDINITQNITLDNLTWSNLISVINKSPIYSII